MGPFQETTGANVANNTVQDTRWLAPTPAVPDMAPETS